MKPSKEFLKQCKEKGLRVYTVHDPLGPMYFGCKPDSCLFCKHCTDMMYDYTNGPYVVICELNLSPTNHCKKFEEDETNDDKTE